MSSRVVNMCSVVIIFGVVGDAAAESRQWLSSCQISNDCKFKKHCPKLQWECGWLVPMLAAGDTKTKTVFRCGSVLQNTTKAFEFGTVPTACRHTLHVHLLLHKHLSTKTPSCFSHMKCISQELLSERQVMTEAVLPSLQTSTNLQRGPGQYLVVVLLPPKN
jgi:hypothetical protein